MKKNKLGQDAAFPVFSTINDVGMSKRFYAACAAMQGLLSQHIKPNKGDDLNWEYEPAYKSRFLSSFDDHDNEKLVRDAYMIADELLKQETE